MDATTMMVKCPTCRKLHEYDVKSPFRPFCSERCKLIDLGAWASGEYRIEGAPGTADPQAVAEEMQRQLQEAAANGADQKKRR